MTVLATTCRNTCLQQFRTEGLMANKYQRLFIILFWLLGGSVAVADFCGTPVPPSSPPPPPPHCCRCEGNCKKSPTFVQSGSYAFGETDLVLATRGFPLRVKREYNSARNTDGAFGFGWSANIFSHLTYTTFLYSAPPTYQRKAYV